MTQEDCAAETSRIEAEETAAGMRHAVAGFDLTFSVPKSVSVLWGVADAATQERIADAHHAAVADVIDFFEREVAATRAGISDSDGAVAQVSVAGVAAVAYDHFDSRAGDPQLHTHVVVSNKVLTVMDGRWRSLDGRPVFASVTGLSAHYNALLADRLSRDIGVEWELRQRGADRNPQWEIVGVSDELDRRVLQPHPRDRAQEGRAHRRVRRAARSDAVAQDHRRAARPGDARDPATEGDAVARGPDRRVATPRIRATRAPMRPRGRQRSLVRVALRSPSTTFPWQRSRRSPPTSWPRSR